MILERSKFQCSSQQPVAEYVADVACRFGFAMNFYVFAELLVTRSKVFESSLVQLASVDSALSELALPIKVVERSLTHEVACRASRPQERLSSRLLC